MSESEKDRLFREGVAAIRAGDKAVGREKLKKVVEIDQLHEQAWLWLSAVVETQEEKITCLQNALTINPNNEPARRGLAQLGVEVEGNSPTPEENAPTSASAASVKPGEEWRADLYKGQPAPPPADASRAKWISDATLIPTEEVVNRSVLDLANAWTRALIFNVAGDYQDHVEDGPAGHILLNVSISVVLQLLATVVLFVLVSVTGRDFSSAVSSYNEMVAAANDFSAVGLVPEPVRPAVTYLEAQSTGGRFDPMDAAVVGSLTLVLALYAGASILLAFVGVLVQAMALNSVATWMGGKGRIIQTTQALSIAMVAYNIVAFPFVIIGAVLPDGPLLVIYGGLALYGFLQNAVAIDAAHKIGVPAAAGAVVIGSVLLSFVACFLGGALIFLLG